jgi:CelD/BcsL family acetyltransferase involved in cellulose biosynthesis
VLPAEFIKMDKQVSAQPDNRYSVEAIVTEQGLEGLEEAWNHLSANSDNPNVFTTFGWFRTWLRRLVVDEGRERLQPYVLAIRQDGVIVGIAPLVRRVVSRFGFRVRKIEFLTHHADYNDLIVGEDQAGQASVVAEFLSSTSEHWEFVDLRDMREIPDSAGLVEASLERAGLRCQVEQEAEVCRYLLIDRDVTELMNRFSGHRRRGIQSLRKRLANEGMRVRVIENPELEPGLLDKLIAVDHQKHLHRGVPSFVGSYPEVFQALINNLGPSGWTYLALIELEDRPVAFQFGFRCGNKLWAYAQAYDRSFARFAPGTMVLLSLLDYGFQKSFREFDFLRGEESYKSVWSTEYHRRVRFLIWNRRWISRLGAFAYFKLHLGRR